MRDNVAATLRQALFDGYFQPGADLSEVALAGQLNVSRGPVREALLMLAQEGLVTHSQNKGFSVFQLVEEDFTLIILARMPLEIAALEAARERVTAEDLAELTGIKDQLLGAYRDGDFAQTTRFDKQFHSWLWEKAGNPWLVLALNRIMVPYFTFTMIYKREHPKLTEDLLRKQHEVYLRYLERATDWTATECVRFHLQLFLPDQGQSPAGGSL